MHRKGIRELVKRKVSEINHQQPMVVRCEMGNYIRIGNIFKENN